MIGFQSTAVQIQSARINTAGAYVYEVKGLLFLTQEEIHRLCREPETLEQYLGRGGRAILNAAFDKSLVLEPFVQLRLLSRILSIHPEINVHSDQ